MKKRILSMLLALVMLLSMLPVQALAESDTEEEAFVTEAAEATQAPETTEAAQTPETTETTENTEAEETTEATEVTETTEAAEAVEPTESTEASESTEAAEETTEPEETPVAAASVSISQAEEVAELVVGGELQLTAAVLPEDTTDKTVVWTSSDEAIATVDETGLVTGVAAGEVTITAVCGEVEGTYELTVLEPVVTMDLEDVPSVLGEPDLGCTVVLSDENPTELLAGQSVTLKASLEPADTEATIVWSLPNYEDNAYANLTAGGVLTAQPGILEKHTITVRASVKDAEEIYEDATVDLIPRVSEIRLTVDDELIEDGLYVLNVNDETLLDNGVTLAANVLPEGAGEKVIWKVSDTKGVCGNLVDEAGCLKIVPTGKTGTATVTATAADGSGKYAKATIRFAKLATSVEIIGAPGEMRGGTSVTLTTNVAKEPGLTDRTILWSLDEDGEAYASINSSGKLTTRAVDEGVTITVTAVVAANPDAYDSVDIDLCPAVTAITLDMPDGVTNPIRYSEQTLDLTGNLSILPEGAKQEVKWTSSNTKIATVDEDGILTMMDAGKVRITCEATDGTGKKAMLYLEIIKPVEDMVIVGPEDAVLIDGQYLNLKAVTLMNLDDDSYVDAANQKVVWSIWEKDEIGERVKTSAATISTNGRVIAKSVKVNTQVFAVARSVENDEVEAEFPITIKPSQKKTLQLYLYGDQLDDSVMMNANEDAVIQGMWYISDDDGYLEEAENCTFYSTKTKVAEVDECGILTTKATGTTNIIVRCVDPETGNLHTAKFTLKVTNLVEEVTITPPKYDYVRSGSSVSLKATAWTILEEELKATNQKFTWELYELDDEGNELETEIATVSSSGKVSAKTVTKNTMVRVYAISQENGAFDYVELTIRPKQAYQLTLSFGEDAYGEPQTGTVTVPMNLEDVSNLLAELYNSDPASDNDGETEDVTSDVKWSSSNSKVIAIEGGVPVFKAPGKATLTAKWTDGKKSASAKITLNLVNAVEGIEISKRTEEQNLFSGKTLYMKAVISNADATNKRVVWSFADDDFYEYATINPNSGLVTAKKGITEQQTITVIARAADGYGAVSDPVDLTIYPLATKVTILLNDDEVESTETAVVGTEFELTAKLDPDNTIQDVKWSSSNTAIASVDQEGHLVAKKRGSVTIKATTTDGSGKSARFTLVVK